MHTYMYVYTYIHIYIYIPSLYIALYLSTSLSVYLSIPISRLNPLYAATGVLFFVSPSQRLRSRRDKPSRSVAHICK